MQDQETAAIVEPVCEASEPTARHTNSVDATSGQPMVARVTARKLELETVLAELPADDQATRADIDAALAAITVLLTGDLENVPPVVVVDMNRWLERTKHVAERLAIRISAGAEDANQAV